MKILHICMACTYTEGFNYQENYLSKYHAKEYETYLITNQFMFSKGELVKSEDQEYVNEDGVHVLRLRDQFEFLPRKINFYVGLYKQFAATLEKIAPDIIFIHNIQFNNIRAVARYVKKHPNVVVYADNHADFSNSGTNKISRFILKTEWRRCAQIIEPYTKKFYGVLPARVDWLVNMYKLPKEKCELLVMGADDDKILEVQKMNAREKIRKQYGISDDDFLIMTGGKIDAWKTQTVLLMEAVRKLEHNKVKLIVFGSVTPELTDRVKALSDGKKVQYIGWVKSENSYQYWSAADLAVFPGRHSVFWEQVAGMGIPMICKYWDGTNHVDCGGNVRFLKQDSMEEIRTELERLLEDPDEYRQMKQIAEEQGASRFSYRMISQRAIEVSKEAL